MEDSKTLKGDAYVMASMLIGSLFPVVAKLTLINIPPLVSYLISVIFSVIPLLFLVIKRNRWHEMNFSVVKDSFYTAFWIGIVFYGFFYFALNYTTAGNASIAIQSEILWGFLFFNVWRKEYFRKRHLVGILLMFIGVLIVLFPKSSGWYLGDSILILATLAAPIGNFFQRRARESASSETILLLRTFFTIPMLYILVLFFKDDISLSIFTPKLLALFFINGVVIMSLSKIYWLEGIRIIAVAKASALNALSPFVVLVISYFFLKENPTIYQIISLVPFVIGTFLLSTNYFFGIKSKKV